MSPSTIQVPSGALKRVNRHFTIMEGRDEKAQDVS